ncbi:MAG: 50S ribosomal protein L24 [bacterium]|nr:50S ribosomal protein L24 [bacterium]
MKIKKGDQVLVISGKDKGRKGKIIESIPKSGRIVIEGINLRKKHIKPKKSGEKGQIIQLPAPMDVSNAKLVCPKCSEASRVGYKIEGKTKYRYCKKCGKEI